MMAPFEGADVTLPAAFEVLEEGLGFAVAAELGGVDVEGFGPVDVAVALSPGATGLVVVEPAAAYCLGGAYLEFELIGVVKLCRRRRRGSGGGAWFRRHKELTSVVASGLNRPE
jgi:hypothetical protein